MKRVSVSAIFLAALWPCCLIVATVVVFLNAGEYDESSGIGGYFLLVMIPLIYLFISVSSFLVMWGVRSARMKIIEHIIFISIFLGLSIFLYAISGGGEAQNKLSHFFVSLLVSIIGFYPIVILESFFRRLFSKRRIQDSVIGVQKSDHYKVTEKL
jgi:hypothetical protein